MNKSELSHLLAVYADLPENEAILLVDKIFHEMKNTSCWKSFRNTRLRQLMSMFKILQSEVNKMVRISIFLISLISFLVSSQISYARDNSIRTYEAANYIGQTKTVCGTISGTKLTEKAFFINLDGSYPNQAFTNVIFKSSINLFDMTIFSIGNHICTNGQIKSYKGKPEIILNTPNQIFN